MQCPPRPGPGIERLEAERLGLGRLDHLPDVDPHPVVEHLQLVDQGDVDGAVGVLEDLAGLGHLGAGDRHDLGRRPGRRGRAASSRLRGSRPPTTLGIVGAEKFGLPGSSRSGLKARKKSLAGLEPAGLEDRQDDVAGGARDRSCSPGRRAGPAGAVAAIASAELTT